MMMTKKRCRSAPSSSSSSPLVHWSTLLLQSMVWLPVATWAFVDHNNNNNTPRARSIKSTSLASSSSSSQQHHQHQQHYHWIGDDASLISGNTHRHHLMTGHLSSLPLTTTAPFATSFSSSASSSLPTSSWRRTHLAFRHREMDDEQATDIGSSFVQWPKIHQQQQHRRKHEHRPQHTTTRRSTGPRRQRKFRVYCDLDGVLVDFCRGIQTLYEDGHKIQNVDDLHRRQMWHKVSQQKDFFAKLPWLDQGKILWEIVQHLEPTILTGVPVFPVESRQQKVDWCQRELGMSVVKHTDLAGPLFQHVPVTGRRGLYQIDPLSLATMTQRPSLSLPFSGRSNKQKKGNPPTSGAHHNEEQQDPQQQPVCQVITCWSSQKHRESGPGRVLIDDRLDLQADWEAKGGIFIHHNGHAQDTIAQLKEHGILDEFLNEQSE